ncbi:laminin subunit gamma-1-like, partial [Tropilaelaps mercedesae]
MEDVSQRKRRKRLDNVAVCTSEGLFDALQGGTVAFRPLDLRSEVAEVTNDSVVLARERWLTAEQIRISLTKITTFGDDMFNVESVLRSYYYTVSDLTIGA